jgi:LuxR family transcriptional regulator, maltose regulon positive regulatory protein
VTRSATRSPPAAPWSRHLISSSPTARSSHSSFTPLRCCSSHARRGTSHAALIAEILSLLAGNKLAGNKPALPRGEPDHLHEPLSGSETRVLPFLPTNLSAPEISGQLSVSVNTVRTHLRHVYEKLGAHSRAEAVERARALSLLAPSSRRP